MNLTSVNRVLASLSLGFASSLALAQQRSAGCPKGGAGSAITVGAQYDTTHVYVAPADLNWFATSFLGTFGGSSTKQTVTTVTPTASSTFSQVLQTSVGTISLFGFSTPIPAPFGEERGGYLVTDMDQAICAAVAAGADVIVAPFQDPIGRDAVIQWPGGINMQLYWHKVPPSYPAFRHIPENRVYVSNYRVEAFITAFVQFAHGRVVSDETHAPGDEIGRPGEVYRRVRIESGFGKTVVLVTDGHLPFPYGRETTGYEVDDLDATLAKAKALGVSLLVAPHISGERRSAVVQFPGGYIAELHAAVP